MQSVMNCIQSLNPFCALSDVIVFLVVDVFCHFNFRKCCCCCFVISNLESVVIVGFFFRLLSAVRNAQPKALCAILELHKRQNSSLNREHVHCALLCAAETGRTECVRHLLTGMKGGRGRGGR